MNTFNRVAFDAARTELADFVWSTAIDTAATEPFIGWVRGDAPSTFADLKAAYETQLARPDFDRYLVVSDDFCENTVYGSPEANHAFRFWHDVTHVTNELNFSAADEFQVALLQQHDAVLGGVGRLARLILWADTQGQTEFNTATGTYPNNQLEFAERYVTAHLANQNPIAECVEAHNREVANDPEAREARQAARLQAFELDAL